MTVSLDFEEQEDFGWLRVLDSWLKLHGVGPEESEVFRGRSVELLTQITNISSGDDAARRYFSEGTCTGPSKRKCTSVTIKNLALRAPYEAKFIVLINDRRPQFVGKRSPFATKPV